MVEISRNGEHVCWTNALYATWDDQCYPGDRGAAMVKAAVGPQGGLTLDERYWVAFTEGDRAHQVHLEGVRGGGLDCRDGF